MKRKFLGPLVLLASFAYAASSYMVTLPSDLLAGDVPLKAGTYVLTLEGRDAVFTKGKLVVRVPYIVDKNDKKFPETGIEVSGAKIASIDLGGTNMMVKFRPSH
jgi:hypothetical protein